jgi:hypothetical protein
LGQVTADPNLIEQLGAAMLRIQADQGMRTRARVSGIRHQAGRLTLVDLKAEACQRLVIEQGRTHLAIGLADYGQVTIEIADRIQASAGRDGLLYGLVPEQLMGVRFQSPSAQWQHLTIELQALEHTCSSLGIANPDWRALPIRLRRDTSLLATLLKRMRSDSDAAAQGAADRSGSATEQMILLHLASLLHSGVRQEDSEEHWRHGRNDQTQATPDQPGRQRSQRLVDQTMDYFTEHIDQHISLQDICSHCGVSARRMQAAFKECMDKTPLQVLQELRLQEIRRQLLAGLSVSEACKRVGLRLSGHIAKAYQKQYGELPRQTLAAISSSEPRKASSKTIA